MDTARLFVGGAAVALASLMSATPAQAQAVLFQFSDTHTETFTAPLEGCLPEDLLGTVTVTETSTGQVVETDNVFTVHGVDYFDYHAEFPDGRYVQSGLNRERFVFALNGPHTV